MKALTSLLLALQLTAGEVRFVDISTQAGLTFAAICGNNEKKTYLIETLGTGIALIDYDNDGYVDLFTVTASKLEGFPDGSAPVNHLYRNLGNGTFKDVTETAGLSRSGWGQGVCVGDFDNDGFNDLFVTYYGHDVLYRNTGKGKFEDVTEAAGLGGGAVRWGTGCAFVDYNLDGKLDLFVANYVQFNQKNTPTPDQPNACRWKNQAVLCGPMGLPGGINRLWRNDSQPGRPRFTDVSKEAGISPVGERYSLSVTTLDYDHDGWPDIYVAVDSEPSLLFRNNHDGTFSERAVEAGVALSESGVEQAGMGTAAADFDGDGNIDLVKTNFIDDLPNLYKNLGDGSFEDVTVVSGLGQHREFMGWGVAFLDFDNDSRPDIFMVNGHIYPQLKRVKYEQRRILYRNLGNRKFKDITNEIGEDLLAEKSSRGLAIGDFDNDGDVDIFISNMNEPPTLLRNDGGNRQRFLNVKLAGKTANRSGIGARVTVVSGDRKLVQEVRSGSSFLSQSDLRLHFGLASAEKVDRIEIDWPGGSKEIIADVKSDQFLTVTQSLGITEAKKARGSK